MQIYLLLFHIACQFSGIFASPTDEVIVEGERIGDTAVSKYTPLHNRIKGYECGNIFFDESEVKNAYSMGMNALNHNYNVQEYQGSLYGDSDISQYYLYPIKKGKIQPEHTKYRGGLNFVVFKRDGIGAVDVISKTSSYQFTKCIRRDGSQVNQSDSNFDNTNGYQCGNTFLSDEKVRESLLIVKKKIEEGIENTIDGIMIYPAPYIGKLFPVDQGYMIWPIQYRDKLYSSGTTIGGPFFLVISKEGEFMDVIVRGFFRNFLRCARSREIPIAPKSDPQNRLLVASLRSGFLCGKVFFDIQSLNKAANVAKTMTFRKSYNKFPTRYKGPPFNEFCWLWPILSDGRLFRKGWAGSYRVALTIDFKVINAVIVSGNNKVAVCERFLTEENKNHDPNSYICENIFHLSNQLLVNAAELGCERVQHKNNKHKRFYPARYEGPEFEKEGPYLTFPVFLNGHAYNGSIKRPGNLRVVMNYSCEVVGALSTVLSNESNKKFVKCQKATDHHPMEESSNDTDMPISEY